MTLTRAVDRARASFRAGLSRTGVVGPPRVRNRPRATTNLPHRLADGTILDEDASENCFRCPTISPGEFGVESGAIFNTRWAPKSIKLVARNEIAVECCLEFSASVFAIWISELFAGGVGEGA
ncbi:hypothetical protein WN48_05860 [Eufriesea mexicana]|uniref:Uncharacterized protein n=1 Tax=Eufriesea mexicana TaxID=516756 RepID=A0A310S8Z7_9HYME|nr:hypothetical protein WN48_05860 [Eufriesea mexicana]